MGKIIVSLSKASHKKLMRLALECYPGEKRAKEKVVQKGLDLLEEEIRQI